LAPPSLSSTRNHCPHGSTKLCVLFLFYVASSWLILSFLYLFIDLFIKLVEYSPVPASSFP